MLRPGLLRQDGVCLASVYDLHQHVQRATVHAEGDRECRGLLGVALQLGLFDATADPPDLLHREEAAGRLVHVHDAVCADSVLVHEPAELDEESVRVGVLVLRAVELFHALGGLLVTQAQEFLHPARSCGGRRAPLRRHQAVDHDCTQAQDVGHLHDVLAQPCRVRG